MPAARSISALTDGDAIAPWHSVNLPPGNAKARRFEIWPHPIKLKQAESMDARWDAGSPFAHLERGVLCFLADRGGVIVVIDVDGDEHVGLAALHEHP